MTRFIRLTIVAMKNNKNVFLYSDLSYPVCKAHAPYYIVISGLSGSTIFFHIFS